MARLAASDKVPKRALVSITGVIELDDLGHSYRSWDADGQWVGGTTRDDQIRLGRVVANDVMKGMSGAPVLLAGQTVAGVVSARYNSGDEWGQGTVWVARTENLVPLLAGLADIPLRDVTEQPAPRQQDFSEVFNRLREIHFTERPWLTGRIQAFLGNRPRGYFFIEGKTGVGKTTLAAEMARQGNYPHHFCSRDSSISSSINTALGSLAAQLVAKFGISETKDSVIGSPGPSEFRSLLGEAAAVAAKRGEQLVLIVDGLDHAEPCPGALPLGLPAELPDNVYVVATTREGILLDERRQYSEHIRIDPNESAVLADIRRHIDATLLVDERLRNRVTERMSAHEFREIVVTRCRGVWIYVRIVLADVRDGRISVDALPDLPTELWTYYSRTLRELGGTNNGDLCLPVLSTLACAAEPLLLTTLCTLADVSSQRQGSVRVLVTGQLRSFVVTVGDGIEGPYIPLHDSARDF